MAVKKQFSVCLENKPGQLAKLCQVLARAKVNVMAISVAENADAGDVRFVPDKAGAARQALAKARMCALARDVVVAALPHEPGALAGAAAKLAAAKINIDYVYGTAQKPGAAALCVFAVDDTARASKILG